MGVEILQGMAVHELGTKFYQAYAVCIDWTDSKDSKGALITHWGRYYHAGADIIPKQYGSCKLELFHLSKLARQAFRDKLSLKTKNKYGPWERNDRALQTLPEVKNFLLGNFLTEHYDKILHFMDLDSGKFLEDSYKITPKAARVISPIEVSEMGEAWGTW